MGDLYGPSPKYATLFTYFSKFCVFFYQPNLWLSGLEHLASYQEVIGLSTRLNFDFFSFKFSKFFKFSDILFVFNFQKRVAKLGAFPINLIIFKAPPVQFCTWLTNFPPSSHCVSKTVISCMINQPCRQIYVWKECLKSHSKVYWGVYLPTYKCST